VVPRPGLIEQLNDGLALGCKLTLVSAPAGFGKTTLVSAWVAGCGQPVAWLSLDEGDNDPICFLVYLIAAVQTIMPDVGAGALAALQSPQPPPTETILTTVLNQIAAASVAPSAGSRQGFVLVLDDYHLIDTQAVDHALTFLLERLPPQMHVVIATREDPNLPLARLRARGQLRELRAADLRFTPAEAADFLNRVMGLPLSTEDIAALETRTEGWIAGLQLAAISMQGHSDASSFIQSFTGSHHFVLDYLMEEVLNQQSENIQTFLLRTSILGRLCGPLCEAVIPDSPGQETLEYLERANLFIVPLDNERHWYRYHHLFGDLLRKRLGQSLAPENIAELHIRASQWYEDQGLNIEAFQHAVAANDVERAERLMESKGMPLHFRGAVNAILAWLASLPEPVLDARPLLRVRLATMALTAGQTTGVDEKIQAAEKALKNNPLDAQSRDLLGQIACARATLAVTQYQPETILVQARRALEYLLPENLRFRFTANWALSVAYHLQGERVAARQALAEALAIPQTSTSMFSTILAVMHLGRLQELDNRLYQAGETYRRVLQMVGDQPQPNASDAYLGLARIHYEWNDLDAAEQYGQQGLHLARQFDRLLDRFILYEVFLARLKLAQGDADSAATMLTQIEQSARQQNFILRLPDIAVAQVLVLLRQGDVTAAARLAQTHALPVSQTRVCLAQGNTAKALALLSSLRQQMEAKGWQDEQLRAMVLETVALRAHGEKDQAAQQLGDALALAEPDGFIRLFVDEGEPMRLMISDFRLAIEKQAHGYDRKLLGYVDKLLAAFAQPEGMPQSKVSALKPELVEPLSQRELDVLRLIAEGLSNHEIGARLFLALDTVKGHNRRIFDKLQVQRRTEAIARARELGLL
jgi:LuxR family maltose regulon positive regulatory protein